VSNGQLSFGQPKAVARVIPLRGTALGDHRRAFDRPALTPRGVALPENASARKELPPLGAP
jgi:hypothetical protein